LGSVARSSPRNVPRFYETRSKTETGFMEQTRDVVLISNKWERQ
jgi:hypothetical protein